MAALAGDNPGELKVYRPACHHTGTLVRHAIAPSRRLEQGHQALRLRSSWLCPASRMANPTPALTITIRLDNQQHPISVKPRMAPTLVTACTALPPEGLCLAWAGLPRRLPSPCHW
jgi:hypothetical protein